MAIKTRRNHSFRPTHSGEPYNDIWEAFASTLSPIFADRLPEGRRSGLYVPVPDAEARIEEYTNSNSNQVAILHGLMGAGKTTILDHFGSTTNNKRKILYLNFQGRRFHLMPELAYLKLPRDDRRLAARTMVTKRINELLSNFLEANLEHVNLNYFEFLRKYFITEIGRKALFVSSDPEKTKVLQEFMSDEDKTAPMQCFIIYLASVLKLEEFTLVVDNIDEQSFEIVEGLFFALSDLLDCLIRPRRVPTNNATALEKPKDDVVEFPYSTRFRAILACRSYTLEALRNDQEGILPTRGCVEIELKSQSLLTSIVKKRIEAVRKQAGNIKQDAPYLLRSGANAQFSDGLGFVEAFVTRLTQAAIESRLFDLFNHNHARALQNLKYILQNRYFVSYDAEVLSRGKIKSDFHYPRVLKALSYGNPPSADLLYYPALSSVVPNIFWWNPNNETSFLLLVRLLKWVERQSGNVSFGNIAAGGPRVGDALSEFEEDLAISPDTLRWALKYCHENGLIFSESGHKSGVQDSESICLSPRGKMVLDQAFRDIVLFEILIDDIAVPSGQSELLAGRQHVLALGKHATRHHFLDTLNWMKMFLSTEKRGLEAVANKNRRAPSNMLKLFDGQLVSELLALALEETYKSFYKEVCNKNDRSQLSDFKKLCTDAAAFYGHNDE